MKQQVYVWPENLEQRLLLVDAVMTIERAVARIREMEAVKALDSEESERMVAGVICVETGARHMRRVLMGQEDGEQ